MGLGKKQYGHIKEKLAVKHLRCCGYKILESNFRTPRGEIDIIAQHHGIIVFVEVKARRSKRYGNPKLALTPAKKRKISMVALEYLKKRNKLHKPARFDVVAMHEIEGQQQIEVIANAFELAYP